MSLYHFQLGFPKVTLPSGKLRLKYSRHAQDAADSDRYGKMTLPPEIDMARAKLIEIETEGTRVVKFVVRTEYDFSRDIVIVAQPDGFVRTVWFNHWKDNHYTLDESKYQRP